jgi:glycolate oxidase FAD binding subunit
MTADAVPDVLAKACSEVRPAKPGDAVAGVVPRFVARPADVAEAAATMRAAASLGMTAVPRGAGTRLAWGAPPTSCDLVIDTLRLNRVLEHAAGDLVVRVQAGVGLDQLAAVLAEAGQRLALDPPPSQDPTTDGTAAGTIGGVLATGAAGPLRLRYGTPRDLAIGITVVRADGTVASSGGKVVKNVAGYDLGKLFAGSYGTLGLIAEAAFRLHPRPGAAWFVTRDAADADAAHAAISAAAESLLSPSAAELDRPGRQAPVSVGVLLEGDPEGVAERSRRMTELLGGASVSPVPPAWWGRGAAAAADGTVVRIAFWAAELARVLRAVDAAASAAGLDPAVSGSAAAGVIYVAVDEQAAAAAVAQFVLDVRAAVGNPATVGAGSAPGGTGSAAGRAAFAASSTGSPASRTGSPAGEAASPASRTAFAASGPPSRGSAVVLHAPAEVRAAVDVWGPVPALGLMRAVKNQFDPEHRMAPGRLGGGI